MRMCLYLPLSLSIYPCVWNCTYNVYIFPWVLRPSERQEFPMPDKGVICISGGNGALGLVMGNWLLDKAGKLWEFLIKWSDPNRWTPFWRDILVGNLHTSKKKIPLDRLRSKANQASLSNSFPDQWRSQFFGQKSRDIKFLSFLISQLWTNFESSQKAVSGIFQMVSYFFLFLFGSWINTSLSNVL